MLISPAQRSYRHWVIDSTRWERFQPRSGDIVITTYPKSGTTWMQRIVSLLLFQSVEPVPLYELSPWIEMRILEPIDAVVARLDEQTHRRFVKTHLPVDGLPIYDDVKYIHVARDGRDACMSYHNHCTAFTDGAFALMDKVGAEDPEIGRGYPRAPADPAAFFHTWLTEGAVAGHDEGSPHVSFFAFANSYWAERSRENFLFVHYNDLQADLAGEMQRVADFLDIAVAPTVLPELAAAAGFDSMRRDSGQLLAVHDRVFRGGNDRFLYKAQNDRWRGVFDDQDLALYDARVNEAFPPAFTAWLARGRLQAGDPQS